MKILGYHYRITDDGNADDMNALGRFRAKRQIIELADDLCPEQAISTIIHEWLEAFRYHLGLEFEHSDIMALESALYQVLTDAGVDLSPLLDRKRNWGVPEPPGEYVVS